MAKISPVSHEEPSSPHEAPAPDGPSQRDAGPPLFSDRDDDRDPSEDLLQKLTSSVISATGGRPATCLESWKTELAEIAGLAAGIDISLRRARDSMTELLESVDEVASRAFDAERSLRDAQSRTHAITNT